MNEGETPTHPAIADVQAALDRAIETIDAEPDPDAAFRHATQLWQLLRTYIDVHIAALRRRIAERIRDLHALSLAKLGGRLGLSKTRMAQMGLSRAPREDDQEEPT